MQTKIIKLNLFQVAIESNEAPPEGQKVKQTKLMVEAGTAMDALRLFEQHQEDGHYGDHRVVGMSYLTETEYLTAA